MGADRQLVEAIIGGDEVAFERLVSRWEGRLRRHLYTIVRDEAAVEDLLQEVLLRVWTRAHQWRGSGSLEGWILRTATNLALNDMRAVRRRRQQPLEGPGPRDQSGEESAAPGWMIDATSLGPDALAEQAESHRLLRGFIATLSEDQREVLRLVYDDQMELGQVADQLQLPLGTVKSRLFHARKQVAKKFGAINKEWERLQ